MIFESEAACDKALEVLSIGPNKYNLNISKSKLGKKFIKVLPKFSRGKLAHHLSLSKELISCMDSECGITENSLIQSEAGPEDLHRFDLQVMYLRKVHAYCYFSAAVATMLT